MRMIRRRVLPVNSLRFLQRWQGEVDAARNPTAEQLNQFWNRGRRARGFDPVLSELRQMAGPRDRCMYCEDSEGADVEHYRPRSEFPDLMFVWENLLLACPTCNRLKGTGFPLDEDGNPLLIDPTSIDPWEHLDYDVKTGNIVARFIPTKAIQDPLGMETVRLLRLAQREHLAEGYRRTYRRLSKALRLFIEGNQMPAEEFIRSLHELDDHRLAGWCFGRGADSEEPFRTVQERNPETWRQIRQSFELE